MFFAPPKVKSLSRYAEYGAYLGNRHFLLMLAIAITVHLSIIAIYSMVPSQEIVRIPVRVLNIKLAGGNAGGGSMQQPAMTELPTPAAPSDEHQLLQPPEPAAPEVKPQLDEKAEHVDKAATKDHSKSAHAASHGDKNSRFKDIRKGASHLSASTALESSLAVPKKYVREGDAGVGKGRGKGPGTGNGSNISGDAGGNEVIERYTQKISQWVKNHQMVAKQRCMQAKDATGECNAKGDVSVGIRIDRDGHMLKKYINKSSGQELVDQLALEIVAASDPLPAVPANYPSDKQMEFVVPVRVDLTARQ